MSLSAEGPTFTVAIGACPHLDGEQQVVGRVTSGMDVLETLSEAKVDDDFAPFERVHVGTCGALREPNGTRGSLCIAWSGGPALMAGRRGAARRGAGEKARLARNRTVSARPGRSRTGCHGGGEAGRANRPSKSTMLDAVLAAQPFFRLTSVFHEILIKGVGRV